MADAPLFTTEEVLLGAKEQPSMQGSQVFNPWDGQNEACGTNLDMLLKVFQKCKLIAATTVLAVAF